MALGRVEMTSSIPWARLTAESIVIVARILMALAADAWWDGRVQRREIRDQRAQLHDQMMANSELLDANAESARLSLEAASTIVQIAGPRPEMITADSLANLLHHSFNFGAARVETNALNTLLGTGEFALSADDALHGLLMRFRADSQAMADDGVLFTDIRERFIDYLLQVAPLAFVSERTEAHGPSDFDFPVAELLRDARLEGFAANLAVRSRNIGQKADRMRSRADSIVSLLEAGAT